MTKAPNLSPAWRLRRGCRCLKPGQEAREPNALGSGCGANHSVEEFDLILGERRGLRDREGHLLSSICAAGQARSYIEGFSLNATSRIDDENNMLPRGVRRNANFLRALFGRTGRGGECGRAGPAVHRRQLAPKQSRSAQVRTLEPEIPRSLDGGASMQ